jgi:hypothetical protein
MSIARAEEQIVLARAAQAMNAAEAGLRQGGACFDTRLSGATQHDDISLRSTQPRHAE